MSIKKNRSIIIKNLIIIFLTYYYRCTRTDEERACYANIFKIEEDFLLLYLKIIYFYTFESKKIKILLPVCNSFNTSCKFKF